MLGTQIVPADVGTGSFTTSSASQAGSEPSGKRNATITLLTIIVPLSVILLIMVFIVVIIMVIIKWRRKRKTHSEVHQGEWSENKYESMLHGQKEALMILL